MKSILLSLILTVSASAFAINLQPDIGAKVCAGRRYLKQEMTPKQKLSKFAVIVEHFPKGGDWEVDHVTAKVVGEHGGKLWGNEAGCDYKPDGSLKCQIECDGGAFTLTPNSNSADFTVMKNYYFPLYKQGASPNDPKPEDILSLEYQDRENRSYRLFEADTAACTEMWQAYQAADHGC